MHVRAAAPRVTVARALAQSLREGVGDRWSHTRGVAARAEELAGTVPAADRETLIIAAWLHDIGYARALAVSGSTRSTAPPARHGWPERIAARRPPLPPRTC